MTDLSEALVAAMRGETMTESGSRQFVSNTVLAVGGCSITVQDVSVYQTACHGIPVALCPDPGY